jgi:superfamily I DNA/RNA helicase
VIEQALRKERIPYTISGGQSFFDKAEIKDIISYLRLLANTDDDPAFIRAVTTPRRGVGQSTLETLGTFSAQWNCSLFEAVFKGGIEGLLRTASSIRCATSATSSTTSNRAPAVPARRAAATTRRRCWMTAGGD